MKRFTLVFTLFLAGCGAQPDFSDCGSDDAIRTFTTTLQAMKEDGASKADALAYMYRLCVSTGLIGPDLAECNVCSADLVESVY